MTRIVVPTKIDKLCDKTQSTWQLNCVQAKPRSAGGAWLTSTNGAALAVVPSEQSEIAETCFVPPEMVAGATPKSSVTAILGEQWTNSKNKCAARINDDNTPYPEVDKVIDVVEEDFVSFIRLDANTLSALAGAISPDGFVVLMIRPEMNDRGYVNTAISVHGQLGTGVVMPAVRNVAISASDIAADFNNTVAAFKGDSE